MLGGSNEAPAPVLYFCHYLLINPFINSSCRNGKHLHVELLGSNDLLFIPDAYRYKVIMFRFWTVGQTKQDISLCK